MHPRSLIKIFGCPLNSEKLAAFIEQMSRVKRKGAFENAQISADSDNPAYAQSIIRAFALHSYIL